MPRPRIDLAGPLRVLFYLRYSSDAQNPRSVEQQEREISNKITQLQRPWTKIQSFQDSGESGQLVFRRPGLMAMLQWIQEHPGHVQAILVDTMNRLGRAEEIPIVVQMLAQMGVVVLVASRNFEDPRTFAGAIQQTFDVFRGIEENDDKGHMVSRGKKDSVLQGYWPGGPPPRGYRVTTKTTERRGSREVPRKIIVPDETDRIGVEKCFEWADLFGWGSFLIANSLREDPAIPESCRYLDPNTIDRILENPIYMGRMEYGKYHVYIQNDVRHIDLRPEKEWTIKDDYCEALVTRERFERVQAVRAARRPSQPTGTESCGAGAIPGLALRYPLSGLVICGSCGRSMVVTSRRDANGNFIVHPTYTCPHARLKHCANKARVPVDWIERMVFTTLVAQLFGCELPPDAPLTADVIRQSPVFVEFAALAQQEAARDQADSPDVMAALAAEKRECQKRQQGWMESLGVAALPMSVRQNLVEELEQVGARISAIDQQLAEIEQRQARVEQTIDPQQVAAELANLPLALAGDNPSATNLELSRHIDTILVSADGIVRMRLAKLAFLAMRPNLMSGEQPSAQDGQVTGRRRARRAVRRDPTGSLANQFIPPDTSIDLRRFHGIAPEWFWEFEWRVPKKRPWYEAHALEVAQSRLDQPCSIDALAARFGKSKPTIRRCLRVARSLGFDATNVDGRKLQSNWAHDRAAEVAEFVAANGNNISAAARHFDKSPAWIREALKFFNESGAPEASGTDEPDLGTEAA